MIDLIMVSGILVSMIMGGVVDMSVDVDIEVNMTDIQRLQQFLDEDDTSRCDYIDNLQAYRDGDWYICGHYSRDLCYNYTRYVRNTEWNTTNKLYPVYLDNINTYAYDHVITGIQIKGEWFFIDPQGDNIISVDEIDSMWKSYKIGKTVVCKGYSRGCWVEGVFKVEGISFHIDKKVL